MKSLRESFSIWSTKDAPPALGPLPKSGVGILPHQEEQQLTQLWSGMIKSEVGCRNTESAVRQYVDAAVGVQQGEERLLTKLQQLNSCHQDTAAAAAAPHEIQAALGVMDNLLPETGTRVDPSCDDVRSRVCDHVRDYRAVYAQLDAVRAKRDALLQDVHKNLDKMEKLRLKGKRSTDVMVEKERCVKEVQTVQRQLVQEGAHYHALRVQYLQRALYAFVETQFLQYGGDAALYQQHVVGSPAHQPSATRTRGATQQHLRQMAALNITANAE